MSKIVCINCGMIGIKNCTIALCQDLHSAGHEVAFLSPVDHSIEAAEHGINFEKIQPWPRDFVDLNYANILNKLRRLGERRRSALNRYYLKDFLAKVKEHDPDLILIDVEMDHHILACKTAGYRMALLSPILSICRRRGLFNLASSQAPNDALPDWINHLRATFSWLRYGFIGVVRAITHKIKFVGLDKWSLLRVQALLAGTDIQNEYGFTQFLTPIKHPDIPILSCHSDLLDFPHDPDPRHHYIGPLILTRKIDPTKRPTPDDPLGVWLKNRDTSRPLIYATISTYRTLNLQHLQRIRDAATTLSGYDFIIGLGGHSLPSNFVLPKNIRTVAFAPQIEILKYCDLAIIQAGINSISECISFGVPMVIYSAKHMDQNGTAARCAFHNLAVIGDIQHDDGTKLIQHIDKAIHSPEISQTVIEYRDQFSALCKENNAVLVVESLL